jgi:chromosome segregation ATPase
MASETTEDGTLTVNLPGELDSWLTERARTLGVDRETVLLQLLASYQAADELDDDEMPVPDSSAVEQLVADRLAEAADTIQQEVDAVQQEVDGIEQRHEEDIEDVRGRVVQLKRELDGKATADHSHEELDQFDDVQAELADVQSAVDAIEEELDSTVAEHDVLIEDIDERLDTLQERLKTVAWVVSDLRDAYESQGGIEAVDRIKRAAAKADIERAKCENCGNGVDIALLTEPECPHCQATVTNVEAADSWFSKPRLLAASQLESGETE